MANAERKKRLDMTLADRLNAQEGWVYMTGMQALVRLPIQQHIRDVAAGFNTGGFISGYRGSPLGRYDIELWAAEEELSKHNIVFEAGVNEDLAATATWGSQYVGTFPGATVDGVFSIWYGKAPGMDRSMDPIRHANMAGTSAFGGSLLLVGDDHGAKSSTLACYSDFNFVSAGIPLLAPSNAQEVLNYGLHGIALSRHSGLLCGLKLVTDVIEGGGSMYIGPDSPEIVWPDKKEGVNNQMFTPLIEQEKMLYDIRLEEALIYARANGLNAIAEDSPRAQLGIVAAGKAYQDLSQALRALIATDSKLGNMDIRVLKIGMVWPLDDSIVHKFAEGLDTILVIEEKRPLLEDQIRSILYGTENAPRIIGKFFAGRLYGMDRGEVAIPNSGEIDPLLVAGVIVKAAKMIDPECSVAMPNLGKPEASGAPAPLRLPSFCAGCPHGRSTKVIAGSRAMAGIGCHGMAMMADPMTTNTMSHMGGEGAMWIGQKPFTNEKHVFANMGDGTYFHSGFLAIRAAVAAKLPITYKLLYNGFVSMTGGQPVDGDLGVEQTIDQLMAEGVGRIALVSDEPEKYAGINFQKGVSLHARTEVESVQEELREFPTVSVLIFEQPCATERRRLRKRGKWSDPDRRVFINSDVCEACGDCSAVSSCMAIEPLETKFGRKRLINQSSCNKDYSCLEGFCPSLVTVDGSRPRKVQSTEGEIKLPQIPEPKIPVLDGSFSILVAGIGGTGVVTIGQTLAVAAHADGLFSSNLDVTGVAQKYGAVLSHVKIANDSKQLNSTRIATGETQTLIGADIIVSAGDEVLSTMIPGKSQCIVSTHLIPTADFTRDPNWSVDEENLIKRIDSVLEGRFKPMDAVFLAEKILGDAVFSNTLLMGATWQSGGIPVSREAMMRAIELNGVAIETNRQAFEIGRLAAHNLEAAMAIAGGEAQETNPVVNFQSEISLESIVESRSEFLEQYQDAKLAERYRDRVAQIQKAEAAVEGDGNLAIAAANNYFKVLAHKDEWEIARLYSSPAFLESIHSSFDGDLKIKFHVGAWPLGKKDPKTGKQTKREVGSWLLNVFNVMSRFRGLRGSWLDPFRHSSDAKAARALLINHEADLDLILADLTISNIDAAIALASVPDSVRGFGYVRERNTELATQERQKWLADFKGQLLYSEAA